MRRLIFALWSVAALTAAPASLLGQSVVLDEGSFVVTVDGRPAGTETFLIRRGGTGPEAQIFATGEIDLTVADGRLDLRPALSTSAGDMQISAYQVKISGQQQQEIYLTPGSGRYQIQIRSERGEQQREVRAAPGTLLLDTGVAHQYYFLVGRVPAGGGTIPVVEPREGRQYELRVTQVGTESLTIGGTALSALHLRLEGNQETRDLWVDGEGRVLRVDHPARGYSALRTQAP